MIPGKAPMSTWALCRHEPHKRTGVFMSIARIGTRATVVGLGVLASLGFTAAPSSAAEGGKSAHAQLCLKRAYPGVLLSQEGAAFKNPADCIMYVDAGGRLAGVNAVAQPAFELFPGVREFEATYSGFGLKPGSRVTVAARYEPTGRFAGEFEEVFVTGEVSRSLREPCELEGLGKVGTVALAATTAAGTEFVREFPGPTGC
jgi:hypothetical protein